MSRGGYFITGTDTGVGKTVVSIGLIQAFVQQGKQVAGLKPVASGCDQTEDGLRNADAVALQAAANVALPYDTVNPYAFELAIAPHLAAAQNKSSIEVLDIERIVGSVREQADIVIVEGVGGWLVPLNDSETLSDLARALNLPVILVVGLRLGCLNHALLSAQAIAASGLKLAGWVANSVDPEFEQSQQNIATLKHWLDAPCLGQIPYVSGMLLADQLADLLTIDDLS
ncbi:MAG: dethiobiotin synthase [Proteobacteria bacterium]|nr:dethiobiotin synthase [Pseudomonadota bacterium]